MTEPRPILKLKLPIKKEVILSKLPSGVVVEIQKAAKKLETKVNPKPKVEAKVKEKKEPVVKKTQKTAIPKKKPFKKVQKITPPRKKALVPYKLYGKMLDYFQAKYPKCFSTPPLPFAIGVHKQLFEDEVELGVSRKQIRVFCAVYCTRPEYIEALKVGVSRMDLLGNEISVITEEEVNFIKSKEKKL